MKTLKQELIDEIPELRIKSMQYIKGEITKAEYKGFSGAYGIYAQRDKQTFMTRLRVPSGVLSKEQLTSFYELAQKCGLSSIHLTTRQAIQFHDLTVDQICMVIEEGINHDIFARGAGGNFPRNVSMSPMSGLSAEDQFDVTPYAVATNFHFIKQIRSYHLPRKFKVAFSSSDLDHAQCTVQDLGFMAVLDGGKKKFRVFCGGGLGNNAKKALSLEQLIDPKDVLYYVDGMVKLFKTYGNYENKHKARVRYIVDSLGETAFKKKLSEFAKEAQQKGGNDLIVTEIDYAKEGKVTDLQDQRIVTQKQSGLYGIEIHPYGGQLLLTDLKQVIDQLANIEKPVIRLAMTEGLFVFNLDGDELKEMLAISNQISQNTNIERSVACIGVPICQMGIQNSQAMLLDLIEYFKQQGASTKLMNILPEIHISGCQNSCGVHQIGAIGLCGKKDKYSVFLGGKCELNRTSLGDSVGDVKVCDLPAMIYQIAVQTEASGLDFYAWLADKDCTINDILDQYRS